MKKKKETFIGIKVNLEKLGSMHGCVGVRIDVFQQKAKRAANIGHSQHSMMGDVVCDSRISIHINQAPENDE